MAGNNGNGAAGHFGRQMKKERLAHGSGSNGGECVEVASGNVILVRDTTDRGGVTLSVSDDAWQRFTASLR